MCGLAGFFRPGGAERGIDESVLARQSETLRLRGPDDAGVWADLPAGIGLAHRRLAILDLSPAGHQPMLSPSGRYVIAFNGEIYNHQTLRAELSDVPWRGHSDTETLLAAIERWGLEASLRRAVGMFALSLWDRRERQLSLARDRVGEKPLYYGWHQGTLLFGSQLSALKAHPHFRAEIDRGALSLLLRHNYIPAPACIYRNTRKLLPGTIAIVSADGSERTSRYWSLEEVASEGINRSAMLSEADAIEELERLIRQSVRGQMIADVPLGAFLSGGVDSSTVVALMQAEAARPVRTFTIGFLESGYNEATYAREISRHLGTEHTEMHVTASDALAVIPELPGLYDEPFADSSQIPTFLVSRLARQHVTVSLSGDGGDELFSGYNRYFWANRIWSTASKLPYALRRFVSRRISGFTPEAWTRTFSFLFPLMPRHLRFANVGDKLHKFAELMDCSRTKEDVYDSLVSHWKRPEDVVLGGERYSSDREQAPKLDSFEHWMMYLDAISYLPDDILVKLDRAAMGVSLESRVPLLDHRVIEFAWRLPLSLKIRNGEGKWILREVLYRYVPRRLIDRPKMGFGVPIEEWLRGPLKEWGESLLNEGRLRREGYFDPSKIRQKWTEHLIGRRRWHADLWNVLMFEAWLEVNA